MDREIVDYIEKNIIPRYDDLDEGHDRRHVRIVVENSLLLAEDYDVNREMVYIVAAFHDLGLEKGREYHHIDSGKILREDGFIVSRFSSRDINTMVEAIEDHRASSKTEPRSIYGKIVSDGDRDLRCEAIIERTILYGFKHYESLSKDEHIQRAVDHMEVKYGRAGYMELYLEAELNRERLYKLRSLIENKEKLLEEVSKIYNMVKDGKSAL